MASFSFASSARALACLGSLVLLGCERKMPPLVDVFEVTPHTLERHERIEIRGAGFPVGLRAQVSFSGTMSSPGERPASVDVQTDGKVTSDETLAVAFDESLEHRFAARGGELRHGTFHGTVEVRFAVPDGTPVHGTREGVELDVRPKVRLDPEADERGRRALGALGMTVADGDGIVVGELAPGGVAEGQGLLPGDRLVELAGVRLQGPADVSDQNVPRPLVVRYLRAGESDERVLTIDAPPFARPLPAWLSLGALGFGAWALAAALLVSRRLTRVRRWEIALGDLLRAPRAVRGALGARVAGGPWSWVPSVMVLVALSLVPMVPAWSELDVPTLFVAWLAARIVLVRPREATTRRVSRVLGWLALAFANVAPLSAVVVLGVHHTAALRALDISAAQGSWRWLALGTPWMAVTTAIVLFTGGRPSGKPGAFQKLADSLGLALVVLVALGGWEPLHVGGRFAWMVPCAFVCKLVVARALQAGLAAWAGRAGHRVRAASGGAVALSLGAVAGHVVLGTPTWLVEWLAPTAGIVGVVAAALLAIRALGVPRGLADELDPA